MHPIFSVLLATIAAHFAGAAILFGIVSGPETIIVSPLLAVFGWFFLPLEAFVATAQWRLLHMHRPKPILSAWLASVPLSVFTMVVIGPKENGNYLLWAVAYGVGTAVAASLSLAITAASVRSLAPVYVANSSVEPSDAPKDRASRFFNGNHNAGPR